MAGGLDLAQLRRLVASAVEGLTLCTHEGLGGACVALGMPEPPGESEGTKRHRVERSLAALPDAGLPAVAELILAGTGPLRLDAGTRNAIQDVLWAGQGAIEVPARTRREIALDLDLGDLIIKPDRFTAFLDRLWVLDTAFDPWANGPASQSLRARIERHVLRNPDWPAEELLEELGAFEAGDARFARFLEGLASAEVIPDEPAQRRVAGIISPHLRVIGAEFRETGTSGGYPVFSVVPADAARTGRPKNLIFASPVKPDLRFRDAVNNDIEVVENAGEVLVYDRPIGRDGILWRDLQAWWRDTRQVPDDDEAKRTLYQRLLASLPASSPPQRNLFALYHQVHGDAVPGLPALLPEVWLHWDPKTARQRGRDALLRFRMDFLLLLPYGRRVVLEVDGAHHYSSPDGRPDPGRYAAGMRADRDLRLSGYEVFRFGAAELQDAGPARSLLEQFFADLFRQFGVTPLSA